MEQPEFLPYWKQFLTSVNSRQSVLAGIGTRMVELFRKHAITNFMNGGLIRQSFDMLMNP